MRRLVVKGSTLPFKSVFKSERVISVVYMHRAMRLIGRVAGRFTSAELRSSHYKQTVLRRVYIFADGIEEPGKSRGERSWWD